MAKNFPNFHGCQVTKENGRLCFVLPFEGAPNGHIVVWAMGNNTTDEIVYETGKRDVLYEAAKLSAKKVAMDGEGKDAVPRILEADDVWYPRYFAQNKRVLLGQVKRPFRAKQIDIEHALRRLELAGFPLSEAIAALESED